MSKWSDEANSCVHSAKVQYVKETDDSSGEYFYKDGPAEWVELDKSVAKLPPWLKVDVCPKSSGCVCAECRAASKN